MYIHANTAAYSPNTLNGGSPKQATQQQGRGFFTAPKRSVTGNLVRNVASTFDKDYWSQPRLIFNSLVPQEQQFLINAIRFETSHLKSATVKKNVLAQLNKISNEISSQVAKVLGLPALAADPKFYHDRTTTGVSNYEKPLLSLKGLKVGLLATAKTANSANNIKASLAKEGVQLVVVADLFGPGVDTTYSASDAVNFDGVIVAAGAHHIFSNNANASSLYPTGRPQQILLDSYRYGKPVGFMGEATAKNEARIPSGPGVYISEGERREKENWKRGYNSTANTDGTEITNDLAGSFKEGLRRFKFLDRFPVERK
jgi:catalase